MSTEDAGISYLYVQGIYYVCRAMPEHTDVQWHLPRYSVAEVIGGKLLLLLLHSYITHHSHI